MPTSPRIYVSLDEKTHQVVMTAARRYGISASALIRQMVEGSTDGLQAFIELTDVLNDLTEAQTAALRGELDLRQGDLVQAASEASGRLSDAIKNIQQTGAGASARARSQAGVGAGAQPPSINKGVKNGSQGSR